MLPARGFVALLAVALLLAGCITGVETARPGNLPPATPPGGMPPNASGPATPPENQTPPENAQQPPATGGQQGAPAIQSEELSYDSFGWKIYGTLYPAQSKEPTKTIYLLHMLGTDRSDYPQPFIAKLHNEIPDAVIVAIDMRGHGRSTNLGRWQDFGLDNYKGMKDDVTSAMNVLKARYPTMKENYAVGASMGSTTAILAAAQHKTVTKVAMISPGLDYKGVAISIAVEDYFHDMFIAASRGDYQSAAAANEIYSLTSSPDKALKIYEGTAHGAELFETTKSDSEPLETLLVRFLKG